MDVKAKLIDRLHIRLDAKHSKELQAALKTVENGRGQNHIGLSGLLALASRAEKAMDALELPRSARRGATFTWAKAGAASTSYRSAIATTQAVLKRDGHGWCLSDLSAIRQWPGDRMLRDVTLTVEQSAMLTNEKLRGYRHFIDKPNIGPRRIGKREELAVSVSGLTV